MANKIIAYACKSACMTYFGNGNFREFFGIERGGGIFKFQNGNSRIPMALMPGFAIQNKGALFYSPVDFTDASDLH